MSENHLLEKFYNLIFGKYSTSSLEKKFLILLTFWGVVISLWGNVVNILLGFELSLIISTTIATVVMFLLYLRARTKNENKYEPYIVLIVTSVFLILSWILNGGFNGNTITLIFLCFFAIYIIIPKQRRFLVFLFFIGLTSFLILLHNYFPDTITPYSTDTQRFTDLLAGNVLFLIMLFFMTQLLIESHTSEQNKVHQQNEYLLEVNRQLEDRNQELTNISRLLKENEERLSLVMESTNDGYWDWDKENNISFYNSRYYTMLGYEPYEYEPSYEKFRELVHPDDINLLDQVIERNKSDKPLYYTYEFRMKSKAGEWKWILTRAKIVEEDALGNIKRIVGTHTDISDRKKTAQELFESRQHLKEVMSNLSVVIYAIDKNGIFTLSEGLGLKKIGLQPGQVVGLSVFEVYREFPDILKDIKECLKGKIIESTVTIGDVVFENRYSPLFDNDGTVKGLTGVASDITERIATEQMLELSEEQFRTTWESSLDGMRLTDENGLLVNVNNAFCQLVKKKKEDLIGKPLSLIYSPEEGIRIKRAHIHRFQSNSIEAKFEKLVKLWNGEDIWFEVSNSMIKSREGKILLLSIFRDITTRKNAELELNKLIENKLHLIEQLESAKIKLEINNKEKDKFFSIIAHDLKNPFMGILGISDLLKTNSEMYSSAQLKKFSEKLYDASSQSYKLLENLLEWSRSQTGRIEFNPKKVNLNELVNIVFGILKTQAESKQIVLSSSIEDSIILFADENMLNTVLRNLLSNSIKFSNISSTVEVTSKQSGSDIITCVTDHGVGIDNSLIKDLFSISAKTTTRGTLGESGTGLGLLICKEFIEKHNGTISVESLPGKSTTFTFSIPIV